MLTYGGQSFTTGVQPRAGASSRWQNQNFSVDVDNMEDVITVRVNSGTNVIGSADLMVTSIRSFGRSRYSTFIRTYRKDCSNGCHLSPPFLTHAHAHTTHTHAHTHTYNPLFVCPKIRELLERPIGSDDSTISSRVLPTDKVAELSKYIYHNRRIAGNVMMSFAAVLTQQSSTLLSTAALEAPPPEQEEEEVPTCFSHYVSIWH